MPEETFPERRKQPRFSLIAEAFITEAGEGGARLSVRVSDLCKGGCYVDTLNPLPVSTALELRIEHADVTCVVPARVIYMHPGYGMGVEFVNVPLDQRAILDAWVAQLAGPKGD
jgi:hypothetical protein